MRVTYRGFVIEVLLELTINTYSFSVYRESNNDILVPWSNSEQGTPVGDIIKTMKLKIDEWFEIEEAFIKANPK